MVRDQAMADIMGSNPNTYGALFFESEGTKDDKMLYD